MFKYTVVIETSPKPVTQEIIASQYIVREDGKLEFFALVGGTLTSISLFNKWDVVLLTGAPSPEVKEEEAVE